MSVTVAITDVVEAHHKLRPRHNGGHFADDIFKFIFLHYIDGLVQERHNSIANALELRLSCTNPSTCSQKFVPEVSINNEPELLQINHNVPVPGTAALSINFYFQDSWMAFWRYFLLRVHMEVHKFSNLGGSIWALSLSKISQWPLWIFWGPRATSPHDQNDHHGISYH